MSEELKLVIKDECCVAGFVRIKEENNKLITSVGWEYEKEHKAKLITEIGADWIDCTLDDIKVKISKEYYKKCVKIMKLWTNNFEGVYLRELDETQPVLIWDGGEFGIIIAPRIGG